MPSDKDVEIFLQEALVVFDEIAQEEGDPDPEELPEVATFEDAGVLTTDKGLVLRFGDHTEFQVSIVRSG